MVLLAAALFTGCQSENNDQQTVGDAAVTEAPLNIVDEIAGSVTEDNGDYPMETKQMESYQVLLDGCSDQSAVYYLYDINGDSSLELIMGTDTINAMTVYAYNENAVLTIGSMTIEQAYDSSQYGLLATCKNDSTWELRQYQYDGEMITETVLVSASSSESFNSDIQTYTAGASMLTSYAVTDRTPFEAQD